MAYLVDDDGLIFCAATSLQRGQATVTVLCTPDDGCGWHPKHVEWTCKIINRLFCVASRWTITNVDRFKCRISIWFWPTEYLFFQRFKNKDQVWNFLFSNVSYSTGHLPLSFTASSSGRPEKITVAQKIKKFQDSLKPQRFITVSASTRQRSLSWASLIWRIWQKVLQHRVEKWGYWRQLNWKYLDRSDLVWGEVMSQFLSGGFSTGDLQYAVIWPEGSIQ